MPENKTQQELDFERKHEQDLQRLRGLRLIDDDFMAAVFEDPACAEFLLQIILFFCTDAKDMFYSVLAERVQYFKQDAKGVATMCRAMEEMRNETVRERNIEIAKTMLASMKLSYEDIALFSGLTVDEVKSLDAKKPA